MKWFFGTLCLSVYVMTFLTAVMVFSDDNRVALDGWCLRAAARVSMLLRRRLRKCLLSIRVFCSTGCLFGALCGTMYVT